MHWLAAMTPVSRAPTNSITSRYAVVRAWTSGSSIWKCRTWESDRPAPTGGIPWRSMKVMNASGSRPRIARQWSVPR